MSDQGALFPTDDRKPWQRATPGKLHRHAHDTERAAAERVGPRTGTLRALAFRTIASAGDDGLTHGELAMLAGKRHYSIAPRVTELVEQGYVRDSGKRRPTDTGSPAIVWVLTERGRRAT